MYTRSTRGSSGRHRRIGVRSRHDRPEGSRRKYCVEGETRTTTSDSSRCHAPVGDLCQRLFHVSMESSPSDLVTPWQRADDDVNTHRQVCEYLVADRPEPPRHPMPDDGVTDRLRDDEAESSRAGIRLRRYVDHRVRRTQTAPTSYRCTEVGRPGDAILSGQHVVRQAVAVERKCYAESSVRPLRRRAPRIARPARVRIRRRKPCTFARRRLFGWKVRLLMSVLHSPAGGPERRGMPERHRSTG